MIDDKDLSAVPSLVLRAPMGPAVAHLVLTVPAQTDAGSRALALLCRLAQHRADPADAQVRGSTGFSFGPQGTQDPCCSVGFTFAGLDALGLPTGYQRLFRRLAPAFTQGAALRAARLGDSLANRPGAHRRDADPERAQEPQGWPELDHERAHVLLTWHGPEAQVNAEAERVASDWQASVVGKAPLPAVLPKVRTGKRLGGPTPDARGEWLHFGYRDGISEVRIDQGHPAPGAPDERTHAPGALLLGHPDDEAVNPFVLNRAPEKVRHFFRNSSFGVLRPMHQDLQAFERAVGGWAHELSGKLGRRVSREFVKAKLGGRWPDGRLLRPGEWEPAADAPLKLNLCGDDEGKGCPFGSHVRRLRAAPDGHGHVLRRPLQRRSMPYGQPDWTEHPAPGERGLLGHFFCASIETQFEHLLGQWAARPPLGSDPEDRAPDPLLGPHEDRRDALRVPLAGAPTQMLHGFRTWTTPLGTAYGWYPGRDALRALLARDYLDDGDQEPWL